MLTFRPLARVLFLSTLVLTGACRANRPPHPELPGCHPACAGAETTGIGDAAGDLRGAPGPQAAPAAAKEPLAPSSAAYLCPMHHHIGADEPGRCPECNMKLVPRAQALEHDHGR